MGPDDITNLIAQLAGGSTAPAVSSAFPFNPLLQNAALQAGAQGVTASNISSAVNPAVLLATGAYDPARIKAMQDEILRQQQADFMSSMSDYLGGASANPDSVFSYNFKPNFYNANPEIADILINGVFQDLKAGTVLPEQAKQDFKNTVSEIGLDVGPELQQFVDSEIDTYAKELPKYYEALSKAPNIEQQMMAESLRPTEETAKYQLFNQLGIPELAFLPSPTEQYQFTPEQLNAEAISSAQKAINPAALRATGALAEMPMAGKLAAMTNREIGRPDEYAVRVGAEAKAKAAMEDYLSANLVKPSNVEKGVDILQKGASYLLPFGDSFATKGTTEDRNAQVRREAEKIYLDTLRSEAANQRRAFSTPARVTAAQVNPALGRALTGVQNARQAYATQRALGAQQATALTDLLTKAGVTPFQQAMRSSGLMNLLMAGK